MLLTVITTQNKKYYDTIGKYCIQSFLKHWPNQAKMILYAEDFIPEEKDSRLLVKNMDTVLVDWKKYTNSYPRSNTSKVNKFWLKSFVLIDALRNPTSDTIVWLDSDVVTTKDIPISFFVKLLPKEYLLCDLPCGGPLRNLEAETGFCMINTTHPGYERFLNNYQSYYENYDKMCKLTRPVDGAVWWAARSYCEKQGDFVYGIPSRTNTVAPWWNSILAEYLLHWIKGKGKTRFKVHYGLKK